MVKLSYLFLFFSRRFGCFVTAVLNSHARDFLTVLSCWRLSPRPVQVLCCGCCGCRCFCCCCCYQLSYCFLFGSFLLFFVVCCVFSVATLCVHAVFWCGWLLLFVFCLFVCFFVPLFYVFLCQCFRLLNVFVCFACFAGNASSIPLTALRPPSRAQVRIVRKKDTGIVWALKSMTKDAMVVKNQARASSMLSGGSMICFLGKKRLVVGWFHDLFFGKKTFTGSVLSIRSYW